MGKRPSHTVASIARDAQRSLRVCSQALGPPRCCQGSALPVSYWESVSCAFTCPRGYATELREDYSKVDSRHSQHEIVPSSHPVPLEFRRWRWSAYGFRRQRWCPLIEFRDKRPDDLQGGVCLVCKGRRTPPFLPCPSHVSLFIQGGPQIAAWARRVTPGVLLRCKITRVGRCFLLFCLQPRRLQQLAERQAVCPYSMVYLETLNTACA